MIAKQTLGEFCDALAARTSSPGGGATAAIVGALGASQLLMVVEYSKWSADSADPRPALREAIDALLRLADKDAEAYAAYRDGPKGDAAAQERIQRVPLETLRHAECTLAIAEDVARTAPRWFAADVTIARSCLRSCAEGARALVEANQ